MKPARRERRATTAAPLVLAVPDSPATPPPSCGWIHPALRHLAVPVEGLRLDPENARRHSSRNTAAIVASLASYGQVLPLIVRPDGLVIVGNGRLSSILQHDLPLDPRGAGRRGAQGRWSHVAVLRFDGSAAQARALGLVDNRAGELAEWNFEALSSSLKVLQAAEFDLTALGWLKEEAGPLLSADWSPSGKAVGKAGKGHRSHAHTVTFTDEQWALLEQCRARLSPAKGGRVDRSIADVVSDLARQYLFPQA